MKDIWKNQTILDYVAKNKELSENDVIEIFSQGKGLVFSGSLKDFKKFTSISKNSVVAHSRVTQKPRCILIEGLHYIELWF